MERVYEFEAEAATESVIKQLKKYGCALVRSHLNMQQIAQLNSEFEQSLQGSGKSVQLHGKHPSNPGHTARIDPWHSAAIKEFPLISGTFKSDFMKAVAEAYYAPYPYSFNEIVFATNEFACETNILPWHFDRVQSLKFLLYLTDTTQKNGAFEYCPGTHWEGRYRAGYHLSHGVAVKDIPNDLDAELIRNPVSMELNAGDLLIFDADGFHRGGIVQPGEERRVLRAHTYPSGRRYHDKPLTPGWWIRSPFNINRWFKYSTTRLLGTRIQEKTKNRNEPANTKTIDD